MLRREYSLLLIGSVLGLLLACNPSTGLSQVGIGRPSIMPEQPLPDRPSGAAMMHPDPAMAPSSVEAAVDGEERQFIELFKRINPSVVHVHVDRQPSEAETKSLRRMLRAHNFTGFRGWISDPNGGSGFVFDADRHILTTNRVVADAEDIQVTFADGTTASATVVGVDPNTDLAALKVTRSPATARPLRLGDSDSLQVGQRVMALGNPLGHGGAMTTGIVGAKGRNVRLELRIDNGFFTAPDLIQTDAVIMAGAVGGPLIDLQGQVVGVLGIDTLLFDAAGEVQARAGGVGFSIPVSTVRRVVPVLLKEGRYPYPWLGISAADMEPSLAQAMGLPFDQRGVLVVRVTPGSPAAKAELREGDQQVPDLGPGVSVGGDVIIEFKGRSVRDFDELVSLLFREGTVGETVTLTIIRDGERMRVPLTLEERP